MVWSGDRVRTGHVTTYEPQLGGDPLRLIECLKIAMSTHLNKNGELNVLGVRVVGALLDCLEAKLNGPRRGPQAIR